MLCALLLIISVCAAALEQNLTCPNISPQEIDIRALDGLWYVTEAATDVKIEGNCTKIIYNHKGDSTTDVSLQWVTNKTSVHYNGTAKLIPEGEGDNLNVVFPSDKRAINYTVLTVSYEHYALLYSCSNNPDGVSSSYELWKLSRIPKLKEKHVEEMDSILANYNITVGQFNVYSNSEEACFTNGGVVFYISYIPVTLMGPALITIFRHVLA